MRLKRPLRLFFAALAALCTGLSPTLSPAQDGDGKAEINIFNFLPGGATVTYDYVFREYTWNLMTYELKPDTDVTYRRPANLPGCGQLSKWGIDQGRFTILAGGQQLCQGGLSICDKTNWTIEVHPGGCRSKVSK